MGRTSTTIQPGANLSSTPRLATVRRSPDGAWLGHVDGPGGEVFEAFRTLRAAQVWGETQLGYQDMVWIRDIHDRDLYWTGVDQ